MPPRPPNKPPEGQAERPEAAEAERPAFRISTRAEAEAYKQWKAGVPGPFRSLVESVMTGKPPTPKETGLPRVDAFLRTAASSLADPNATLPADADPFMREFFEGLKTITTNEGPANALELLTSRDIPFETKSDIWKNHIASMVEWLADQDLTPPEEIAEEKQPEQPPQPPEGGGEEQGETAPGPQDDSLPPPETDEMQPSMDEMAEQKEKGGGKAYFTVTPFYGGYFRQNLYGEWDDATLKWKAKSTPEQPLAEQAADILSSRLLQGSVRGRQKIAIPLPYNWVVNGRSLQTSAPGEAVRLTQDGHGNAHIEIDADGVFSYNLIIGKRTEGKAVSLPPGETESRSASRLPGELAQKIVDLGKSKLTAAGRARMLIKAVRERLEYSNDSNMNAVYRADTVAYFERIWQEKKADCDVANTVAATALRPAGIPSRLATGYYVKNAAPGGKAEMTSGMGHAWLEVFDADAKQWFRADATPKGDPTLDEERPDEEPQQSGEGDYGEQEAEIMSDEDLEKLIESLEQGEGKAEASKTSQERGEEQFAREAGISEREAREVLEMFRRVREIKNEKGERIQQQLIGAWKQLVQSRRAEQKEYQGPVRMSEGDELTEPALAVIDIAAGEKNPSGFEKIERVEKRIKLFGGLDIYLAADLSGSMSEVDPESGRVKAELQRDAVMLYVDSLMQCAFLSRQAQGRLTAPLPIRVQITSFHGDVSTDLPLAASWGPKEQYALYKALVRTAGGGTPDASALRLIKERIEAEREVWEKARHKPGEQAPIAFVAAFLDGGSDNPSATKSALSELREAGTVAYGYGMTAAAKPIKAIYAPNSSVIETLDKLAPAVASDTIAVFQELYPSRVKGKAKKKR